MYWLILWIWLILVCWRQLSFRRLHILHSAHKLDAITWSDYDYAISAVSTENSDFDICDKFRAPCLDSLWGRDCRQAIVSCDNSSNDYITFFNTWIYPSIPYVLHFNSMVTSVSHDTWIFFTLIWWSHARFHLICPLISRLVMRLCHVEHKKEPFNSCVRFSTCNSTNYFIGKFCSC